MSTGTFCFSFAFFCGSGHLGSETLYSENIVNKIKQKEKSQRTLQIRIKSRSQFYFQRIKVILIYDVC